MKPFRSLAALAQGVLLCCGAAAAEPVRFLVPVSLSMPLAEIVQSGAGPTLARGILFDWQNALARQLGREAITVVSPRKRLDFAHHQVDLYCFTRPEWTSNAEDFYWPATPFLTVENWIVGAASAPPVREVAALKGKRIGAILGYHYPTLDPLFAAEVMWRDNAQSEALMIQKQLAGRHQYMLIRALNFEYQKKINPELAGLKASPLSIERGDTYCAVAKQGRIGLAQLEQAQDTLIKNGELHKILQRYK